MCIIVLLPLRASWILSTRVLALSARSQLCAPATMGATMAAQGERGDDAFQEFFDEIFGPTRDGERRFPAPDVKTGDRVVMHGLGRAELNGRFAVVLDPQPLRGRYHLRLEDTDAEIRARGQSFTKIVAAPSEVVDLEEEGLETGALLHGSCCVCLIEKACHAMIPCGHLVLCAACAPRARGSCPICRRRVLSLLRVYTPGGTREEELEKAIHRCRAAEKHAQELEEKLQQPRKRARCDGGQQKRAATPKPKQDGRKLEVGYWVRMPTMSANKAETPSPHVEYSQQVGEVVALTGKTCRVRFRGVDPNAFAEQGIRQPGEDHKDVELPLEMPWQAVYTAQEAEWKIAAQDRFCVCAAVKTERQRKLRAERRSKEKQGVE